MPTDQEQEVLPEAEDVGVVKDDNEPSEELEKETPAEPVKPEVDFDIDSVDPTKLTGEAAKYYKGFQKSYTQKMQGLSQALEGLKSHSTRLQMLDRAIAGDREATAQLAQVIGAEPKQPSKPTQQEIPAEFASTKHLTDFFDQRVSQLVEARIAAAMGQYVQPIQQNMQQQQQMLQNQRNEAEYNLAKKEHPDFDTHLEQMVELRRANPGLSLEQTYRLATYKVPVSPSQLISKPGVRPSGVMHKSSDHNLTFEEAAEAAIKQLKRGK